MKKISYSKNLFSSYFSTVPFCILVFVFEMICILRRKNFWMKSERILYNEKMDPSEINGLISLKISIQIIILYTLIISEKIFCLKCTNKQDGP